MKSITEFGMIEKGKLEIFHENIFLQTIQDLGFVNHCKIEIEYGNKRTLDQNAYLWGAIVPAFHVRLMQEGYNLTQGEAYNWLENKFCKDVKFSDKSGNGIEYVMQLKALSTDQFEEKVVGNMRGWLESRLGSYVKLPHEFYGIPLDIYNQWKKGEITRTEAMKHKIKD